MKLSAVLLFISVSSCQAFSMMTPAKSYFPQKFGRYLIETDNSFDKDWPSTFMEKELDEFQKTLSGTIEKTLPIYYKTYSPKYEAMDTEDKFEVKLHLPEFKANEIDVELRAAGRLLTVTGKHEEKHWEKGKQGQYSTKFQHTFSLDPSIMVDEITATYENGEMVIGAPRQVEHLPENKKIPIKKIGEGRGGDTKMKVKSMESKEAQDKEHIRPQD